MSSDKLIYAKDARRAILKADPSLAYCIDNVPGVDAVVVVRCKMCEHKRKYHQVPPKCYCKLHERCVLETDFCSKGVERNDDC